MRRSSCTQSAAGCLILIALAVIALFVVAAFAADGEEPERESSPATPDPVAASPATTVRSAAATSTPAPSATWAITSDATRVGSNYRFVDVVLSQRVSEPELTVIAERIRQQSADHPVVHILYWIDGMDTERGAWATTRFEQGHPINVRINDYLLAPTAAPQPMATPNPTAAPQPTPTLPPTSTPTPQITYAACDDVPTHLLRLDTQGRVAVDRQLVPDQPDGDSDGFACGDQLEHRREAVAAYTAAPTATSTRTARPTQAPTQCPTGGEGIYLIALGEQYARIELANERLVTTLRRAIDNPGVLNTDLWVLSFAASVAEMQVAADEILALTPPTARTQPIDRAASAMARTLMEGLTAMITAVDERDDDQLQRGNGLLQQANAYLAEARRLTGRLC